MEHGGRAHAEREEQPVAQAVGKEQFGHREGAVPIGDIQSRPGVQIGRDLHVVLQVHCGLGKARGSRTVEPETGVVLAQFRRR